jgi:zinc transport system substrate-binding protein
MKKLVFIFISIVSIILLLFILFFTKKKSIHSKEPNKIAILTTIFPIYDFTKNVGGDKVIVKLILAPTTEVHNYEPTPSDIMRINESDIFIYTGSFMEPWVDGIVANIKNKKTIVLNISSKIPLPKEFKFCNKKHTSLVHTHKHDNSYDFDPHIWLDFDNAKSIVIAIAEVLKKVDPNNASYYKANASNYNEKLTKLDISFRDKLSNSKTKKIVHGGHYSFGYLAKRYGLVYRAAQGFSPNIELTANDLVLLVEEINKNSIKYIFYEELENSKIAETLAKETGAKLLLLHSAHNLSKKDYENGATFISLMENNLHNLLIGLNSNRL